MVHKIEIGARAPHSQLNSLTTSLQNHAHASSLSIRPNESSLPVFSRTPLRGEGGEFPHYSNL